MPFPSTEKKKNTGKNTGYSSYSLCAEGVNDKAILSLMEARNDPMFQSVRFIITLSSLFIVISSQATTFLQSLEVKLKCLGLPTHTEHNIYVRYVINMEYMNSSYVDLSLQT